MKPYREYKMFQDMWIAQIPQSWKMRKMKFLFNERSEKGYSNEPLLVASQEYGVILKSMYESRTVEATKDLQLLKLVRVGDFVISLRSFQGGIEYAYYRGIISPAYTILIANREIHRAYFKFLAKSKPFIHLLQQCVVGIREGQNISYALLKNHYLPLPPITEQKYIAIYLERQNETIDQYIATKQKEISVLEEYKQTIINEAVTKGLDCNVPMKDSGIEWIGEIPAHWEVSTVRRFYKSILGKMLQNSSKSSADTVEKYLCAKDIHFGNVDTSNLKSMWFSEADKKIYHVLDGDLLIVEGGAGAGGCSVYHGNDNIFVQNSVHVVRPKSYMTNTFLCYWLEYLVKRGYIDYACNKATIPHFTKDKLLDTPIVILPINEQYEIITYINERIKKILALIATIQKQITFLNEYRTTLISDVVTGQVNVSENC